MFYTLNTLTLEGIDITNVIRTVTLFTCFTLQLSTIAFAYSENVTLMIATLPPNCAITPLLTLPTSVQSLFWLGLSCVNHMVQLVKTYLCKLILFY